MIPISPHDGPLHFAVTRFSAVLRLRRRRIMTKNKDMGWPCLVGFFSPRQQPPAGFRRGRKFTPPGGARMTNEALRYTERGRSDGTGPGSITVNVGQDRVCGEFTFPHRPADCGISTRLRRIEWRIVVDFFKPHGGRRTAPGCTTARLARRCSRTSSRPAAYM